MSSDRARIDSLFHYPVKGLSPQPLAAAELAADAYFPDDRLFAVENGPSGYDPAAPRHMPKMQFLMLMRNARLAALRTHFDSASRRLRIERDGMCLVDADLGTPDGIDAVESLLADCCADELRGPPRLLAAPEGFRFTDSPKGFVSLVNLASVGAVEAAEGRPVDPLRFRGNLYVSGWAPWIENDLVGRRLRVGEALLEVSKPTERCAATGVDPATGRRDMNIVATLMRRFGNNLCGIYARVVEGGPVRAGDAVMLAA